MSYVKAYIVKIILFNCYLVNFKRYVDYTKELNFTSDPDYNFLKSLFIGVLKDEGLRYDFNYEWNLSKSDKSLNEYVEDDRA